MLFHNGEHLAAEAEDSGAMQPVKLGVIKKKGQSMELQSKSKGLEVLWKAAGVILVCKDEESGLISVGNGGRQEHTSSTELASVGSLPPSSSLYFPCVPR